MTRGIRPALRNTWAGHRVAVIAVGTVAALVIVGGQIFMQVIPSTTVVTVK